MDNYDLTNTRTAINLATAFAGESQARTRYLFYSEVAKDEGFPTIEQVFLLTADNERGHAEMFYDYLSAGLNGKTLHADVGVPIELGTTPQNLKASAGGEQGEADEQYLAYAKEAEQEGFPLIAVSFAEIAKIEGRHHRRFVNLWERYQNNMLYQLPYEVTWECTNCGYQTTAKGVPNICPSCHHAQSYFKVACKDVFKLS